MKAVEPSEIQAKIKKAYKIKKTLKDNKIYAYRAGIGEVKPTWYQQSIHQGGVTGSGQGAINLGRVARARFCFMPNQCGKSFGGAADDVMNAYGIHPHIDMPVPNIGMVLTVSHLKSVQIMRPLIWNFIPEADKELMLAKKYGCGFYNQNSEKPSRMILPNGSEIHFMSADQDAMEFESLTINWAHADEEPPKSIYDQLHIRLLRHQGYFLCTMTPWQEEGIGGVSWTMDDVLENHKKPPDERSDEIWIAPYITMHDAPWLDEGAVNEWRKKCKSKEEYNARFMGIHMMRSGKIFELFREKTFSTENPVESGHLLREGFPLHPLWNKILLMDPSSSSGTTAGLWVALTTPCVWQGIVFKGNELVCYREYKEKDLTVTQHASNLLIRSSEKLNRKLMDGRFMRQPADSASGETYGQMYQRHGMWFESWGANQVANEIDSMKEYLQGTLDRTSNDPGLFIVESLRKLRWEINHYIYPVHRSGDEKGERKAVQKKKGKDIHLLDCLKAGCNLRLLNVDKAKEQEPDYSPFQNPLTGI